MVLIPLTKGFVAIVDDEDERLAYFSWHAVVRSNTVYAQRSERFPDGRIRMQMLHRAVMGLRPGQRVDVDHINSDGLDNRRANLRVCTRSQNNWWGRRPKTNTHGYIGVGFDKRDGSWYAHIRTHGHMKNLGRFPTKEAAAKARDRAALARDGVFARLNFPEGAHQDP
jgi:hypothetical protein